MPEEKAGRLLEDSWQKKPGLLCWLWSFCSFRSCQGMASFPFLVTSSILSSHCSHLFHQTDALVPVKAEESKEEKDSCSETLFKFGPAVTVKSSSQTDTA